MNRAESHTFRIESLQVLREGLLFLCQKEKSRVVSDHIAHQKSSYLALGAFRAAHGNTPKGGNGKGQNPTRCMDQGHESDQLAAKLEQPVYVSCSCCGKSIEDSTDQNTSFGMEPYPHDQGFGMCFDCGGDAQSDDIREQLGWAGRMFFETRMRIVREHLKPDNRAKFDAMDYERKVAFVARCVERGLMI